MPRVAFSPRKGRTVIYGLGGAFDRLPHLGKHATGQGCLYIKRLAEVNLTVLGEMIDAALAARPEG